MRSDSISCHSVLNQGKTQPPTNLYRPVSATAALLSLCPLVLVFPVARILTHPLIPVTCY
jgi:hypothetical protein